MKYQFAPIEDVMEERELDYIFKAVEYALCQEDSPYKIANVDGIDYHHGGGASFRALTYLFLRVNMRGGNPFLMIIGACTWNDADIIYVKEIRKHEVYEEALEIIEEFEKWARELPNGDFVDTVDYRLESTEGFDRYILPSRLRGI